MDGPPGPTLQDLPPDVLGHIISLIDATADRLSLSTASLQLLHQLASSAAAWGRLSVRVASPGPERSLAAWLARRGVALHKLHLRGAHCGAAVAAALWGSAVQELEWHGACVRLDTLLVLAPLPPPVNDVHLADCARLPALRRLDLSVVQDQGLLGVPHSLPSQLTALRLSVPARLPPGLCQGLPRQCASLHELHISVRNPPPQGDAEFAGAAAAVAGLSGLTALALNCWSLAALPRTLSKLTVLEELVLERGLGQTPSADALAPLAALPTLTMLDLTRCNMRTVPTTLRSLTRLEKLTLNRNPLGEGPQGGEGALPMGGVLTSLHMECCRLAAVPLDLASLPKIREVSLAENLGLRSADERAFQALATMGTSLSRLSLARCDLRAVPASVAALQGLVALDLSNCRSLGASASSKLGPLCRLTALTALSLACCDTVLWPRRLPRPAALVELRVY